MKEHNSHTLCRKRLRLTHTKLPGSIPFLGSMYCVSITDLLGKLELKQTKQTGKMSVVQVYLEQEICG